ncbi:MAG: eukaryotic-like serine/threonine-protein kinase [Acidobacteriota bacterium]|jgi:serine/threonine-protein kinase
MQTIGRYKLLDTLGQGGMGVVYRAFDTLLERTVALKVIGAQIDSNPETRTRFLREARAAGQLAHQNIVTIHDLGEHDGHPFLAMEYLEGQDLQQRLSGNVRMSLARKVDLAIDICEGLEYAHAHGVVHRDVKPANIFITTSGQVKILDFGLARLITSELTNSNMLMGTLNYMAPEQVRGERADHRADIFSVGVVLYELLGSKKAFEGDSFASTMYKILQEVPEPLWQVDATVPRALAGIVERALAKPLDERYQSMTALREDLVNYRDQIRKSDSGAAAAPVARPVSSADAPTMLSPGSAAGITWPNPPGSGSGAAGAVDQRPSSGPLTANSSFNARWPWIIAAGAVVALAAFAISSLLVRRPAAPAAAPKTVERSVAPDTSAAIAAAERALEAHDFAGAEGQAQAVLRQSPDDRDARRILDRARAAGASVDNGLRQARASLASGDFQAASRAAGDVLTVAPANAEARQIMEQGAARAGARTAADARLRMIGAREQARASKAPTLVASAYRAALRAEQAAQRLLAAGRTADATARFYEASGLYESAASLAQARLDEKPQSEPAPAAPEPAPVSAPQKPAEQPVIPAAPVVTTRPALPEPQPSLPVVASPAPPTPPPVPVSEDASPRGQAPEEAISQLLARYKAALEARDLDALRKIWPGLTEFSANAIRNDFQNATRLTVDVLEPRIVASGASGTVTFRRRYELQTHDGQRLRTETQTTMAVRRGTGGWIIESVRFSPAR